MNTIIVKLTGGMGNQMFQYAAARQLSLLNQATLLFDLTAFDDYKLRRFSLQPFALRAAAIQTWEAKSVLGERPLPPWVAFWRKPTPGIPPSPRAFTRVKERGFAYDASFLEQRGCLHLEGYWQSPRYFAAMQAQLREDFQIVPPLSSASAAIARQITLSNSVSLHVRRTDYVTNPRAFAVHGVCSTAYYLAAAEILNRHERNPCYFIFSDDLPWAREHLRFPGKKVFVVGNTGARDHEDLRLMSLCRHHITANSTFSWWGAWLGDANGLTITPARWFKNEANGPPVDDLLPPRWLRVDNEF